MSAKGQKRTIINGSASRQALIAFIQDLPARTHASDGTRTPWRDLPTDYRSVKQFIESQFRAVVYLINRAPAVLQRNFLPFSHERNLPEWKCRNETNPPLEEGRVILRTQHLEGLTMTSIGTNWCSKLLLAAFVATAFVPAPTRADVIIDWNIKSDEIAAQKQILPFNHSR